MSTLNKLDPGCPAGTCFGHCHHKASCDVAEAVGAKPVMVVDIAVDATAAEEAIAKLRVAVDALGAGIRSLDAEFDGVLAKMERVRQARAELAAEMERD